MKKSEKNKLKDYKRTKGKKWVDSHVHYSDRKSGSGVRFEGFFVKKMQVKECLKKQEE